MPTYESIALVGNVLNFNFSEMMDMWLDEFNEFVKISIEILKHKAKEVNV